MNFYTCTRQVFRFSILWLSSETTVCLQAEKDCRNSCLIITYTQRSFWWSMLEPKLNFGRMCIAAIISCVPHVHTWLVLVSMSNMLYVCWALCSICFEVFFGHTQMLTVTWTNLFSTSSPVQPSNLSQCGKYFLFGEKMMVTCLPGPRGLATSSNLWSAVLKVLLNVFCLLVQYTREKPKAWDHRDWRDSEDFQSQCTCIVCFRLIQQ